jgi:hypothetical protein
MKEKKMEVKAIDIKSGDIVIGEDSSALVLNVRRLMVCGTPQVVHLVLDQQGTMLFNPEHKLKIVTRPN